MVSVVVEVGTSSPVSRAIQESQDLMAMGAALSATFLHLVFGASHNGATNLDAGRVQAVQRPVLVDIPSVGATLRE